MFGISDPGIWLALPSSVRLPPIFYLVRDNHLE